MPINWASVQKGQFMTGARCQGCFAAKREPLPREFEEFESADSVPLAFLAHERRFCREQRHQFAP
jgi:hypothetical protein